MRINLGKALKAVAKAAKDNPEIALAIAGLIAPKLATKAAKAVVAVKVAKASGLATR